MKLHFSIHYNTSYGQEIYLCGSSVVLGNWDVLKAAKMNFSSGNIWSLTIENDEINKYLEYKYLIKDEQDNIIWEWGDNRRIIVSEDENNVIIEDSWRAPSNEEKVMFSSAFTDVIMKPSPITKIEKISAKKQLQFKIQVPRISRGFRVCVLGNQAKLGSWDKNIPLLLRCNKDFPTWTGSIDASGMAFPLKYKYGIYDIEKKIIVTLEEGPDRLIDSIPGDENQFHFIKSDESFRYPIGNWKGAGVAVPVFSLRSKTSFGVGEFSDLIEFIDWAKTLGIKMIQILPINETIASHNWLDSYPYKAISVMALHPIYMNIKKMGILKDKKQMDGFNIKQKELNDLPYVNYPEVLKLKSKYYKLIYDQEKDNLFTSSDYKNFFKANKDWLIPYAAFVYLRDKMANPDFREWNEYSAFNKEKIEKLSSSGSETWDDIAVHYFIQYHLDKQMKEVTVYARQNGIVLKGDIPIGISPDSVEAWTEPHLFNLDAQAGAPPDAFAINGQNWGFPTYNWEEMGKDNFKWWKMRLQKMAKYFDAYRIDHILGFFRIWEIPVEAVQGLLGYFNPALPLRAEEIRQYGIHFDYERLTEPYIRHHLLDNLFGEYTGEVIAEFLEDKSYGNYRMKEQYNTQRKINRYFLSSCEEEELSDKNRRIRDGLFFLIANVVFITTGHDEWHPRISMQYTSSFADLDENTQNQLNKLYIHYYYKRHNDFWYHKALEKLPAIIDASNMLVCGEDLGMVPDCVQPVMDQLYVLSLEIQRMSKNPEVRFAHPSDASYLSVCSSSTHDMPTIRGWWEENRESTQHFYNNELGNHGGAPFFAEPWICQQVITQHMYSPAMWSVFPIQDLLAMDGDLRWENTHLEQINFPDNVRHKWRFRMHQSIDDLKNATEFNELLKRLIEQSGRNSDY